MDYEKIFNIFGAILLASIVVIILYMDKRQKNVNNNIKNKNEYKMKKDLKFATIMGLISLIFCMLCMIGMLILFISAIASGSAEEMLLTMIGIPVLVSLPFGGAILFMDTAKNIVNKYNANNIEIPDKLIGLVKFNKYQHKIAGITLGTCIVLLFVFAILSTL